MFTYIGSGPNFVTAQLGAAKMKEITQTQSEATNLEEYAHLYSLSIQPDDPIFLITADAPIDERNRMVAKFIQGMHGRLFVVGPQKMHSGLEIDLRYDISPWMTTQRCSVPSLPGSHCNYSPTMFHSAKAAIQISR